MIDAHCHLDDGRFAGERVAVLQRAAAAGVREVVLAGSHPSGWVRMAGIAGLRVPGMRQHACYGIHPEALLSLSDEAVGAALHDLETRLPGAVALGECGLDRRYEQLVGGERARQESTFGAQLELAQQADLPVVVHCVGRYGRLFELLQGREPPGKGFLLHGYAGPAAMVPAFVSLGCVFSFGGPLTWPEARRIREAARAVPDQRLLVETDAPCRGPQPFRHARNEPARLGLIVAELARLRGMAVEDCAALTGANARRFFSVG